MRTCVSISLNRSGSTFFMTTLNTFPNVYGDFEINLSEESHSPLHRALSTSSLDEILSEILAGQKSKTEDSLVVSKIVLAPQHKIDIEQAGRRLASAIEPLDYPVVILRPWFQQFLSKFLGGGHLSSNPGLLPVKIREAFRTQEYFSDRLRRDKTILNLDVLEKDLMARMALQTRILHPLATVPNVRFVSYANLNDYMQDFLLRRFPVANTPSAIRRQIDASPAQRLPSPRIEDLFDNAADVQETKQKWQIIYGRSLDRLIAETGIDDRYLRD